MVKIVWTQLSIEDLNETYSYIASDSIRYASITIDKIYNRVQILSDKPYVGRIVPEFNTKTIRELIEGNYRIIYRLKRHDQIDILRVYHSARFLRKKSLK